MPNGAAARSLCSPAFLAGLASASSAHGGPRAIPPRQSSCCLFRAASPPAVFPRCRSHPPLADFSARPFPGTVPLAFRRRRSRAASYWFPQPPFPAPLLADFPARQRPVALPPTSLCPPISRTSSHCFPRAAVLGMPSPVFPVQSHWATPCRFLCCHFCPPYRVSRTTPLGCSLTDFSALERSPLPLLSLCPPVSRTSSHCFPRAAMLGMLSPVSLCNRIG